MKELYAISNRCYSALRNALPTLLGLAFLAFSQQASAQLINPAAEGGFENGTTFAANGWSIDNGAALNTWVLGTVPPGFSNRSAFVTNDGGTSWAYTNTNTSVVHFWRDVTFPAGQSIINLSFNWQALGETSSFDALMVSVAPTTYTPTASTASLGTGVLAAPAITLGQFWNVGTVQTANLSIPSSLIGNCSGPATWRLIFTWKNDGSLGTSPPIAIDNISLTASAPVLTPMAGTYTVGTGGNYLTLTAAVNDVNARGVSAPVILELNNLYTSASETFPITLGPNAACAAPSSVNTVTIRPAAGAPLLSITGANAGPTIDFSGGNWWRIDGRPGGAGTTKGLVISNTNVSGQAIRLINDASNNIVRYCDVQGVNTSTTSGVVLFSTTTGTTGNDNNLIEFCDVHDGATTPANCIISSGTSTTIAQFNSNNTVSNCNIYNWFLSTSTSLGIQLTTGSSDWTITGNSFYQTVARTLAAAQFSAINIPNTTGNYFTITNNFIGGSAPSCGGTAMTLTGAGNFRAVNMTVGAGTSLVQGNTIQNINLNTSNATNFNGALLLGQGSFLANNNTIGSLTANGSIVVTSNAGSAFVFNGIILGGSTPTNTSTISNNSIGGISLTVTGAPATPGTIRGISIQGTAVNHNYVVTGNTIGSTTLANNITMDGNSGGFGIVSFSTALGQVISNNTISNITSTNSGTGTILWGILAQGGSAAGSLTGTYTLTGNTVQNLSCGTGNAASFALNGIQTNGNNATVGTNIVQQNTVRNLAATNPAVSTNVGGIVIVHPLVTNNLVARNLVHSLTMATTTNAGTAAGIFLAGGSSNVENNMVRLGVDGAGADITSGYGMIGILEGAGNNNVRFNSVYIGGSGVSAGATNTFAFNSTVTTGARNYTSNIFFNARSNGAGTGKHYAIAFGGTAANPAGVASNYNDLFVTGTGGFIGLYNATDQATIGAWRTATGNDFQSVSGNPQYINPTGNSASVDLHIQAATPTVVEAAGQPVAAVTTDYDSQTRASLTPTDIGADAGNFLLSDVAPPGIGYTPLIGACGTNDFVLNGVNITDGTGIPLAGALIPRIYFRKNAGSWFSRPGVLAGGGATNSTWNFTIVVADMGGVANGDIVDYYVIAQDNLGNVGSNAGGVVATDVNTVTTHPVTPNSMTVTASLSGTYTVGAGGNYATLTAAVADYNTRCISGPVVFSLTDGMYTGETFPITINSNIYASSTNTLTIKPAAGNNATISGTSATGLIVLNGADWVIINGSNGSTPNSICPPSAATRNLTLTNTSTSTTSAVIWLQNVVSTPNGASNNQVINCNISGNGPLQTLCGIGSGSPTLGTASLGTNNNNNSFINNNISNAQYGIISQGNSAFNKNTGNVINQNLMNTAAPANLGTGGVFVTFEDGIVISGNNISGMSQTSSPDVAGINAGFLHSGFLVTTFAGNECTNVTITNNIIGSVVNSGSFSAVGIALAATSSGTSLIANNMISGVAANGTASDFGAGIVLGGGTGSTINVFYNTVSMQGTITGASNASVASTALAVTNNAAPSNLNIRNNILSNTQAANGTSTQRHTAIALGYSGTLGNYAGLNSNNNDLYSAGPGPGSYHVAVVGGIAAGPVRTTLANWQTETGRDANSFSVQPNFVSTTDLHLVTTSNQCLDGGGAPISVTTDIDCQTRNASIPDIGADEFTNPNLTITISENSGTPNDGTICSGSQVIITAAGGGTYLWSPGGATTASITVTPTATTTYTVTVTNGTCTDVLSQVITVNTSPTLSATLTQPTTCVSTDGAINLTVTNGGTFTVNWADIPGTNDPEDRTGLIVGTYNVTVTNTVTGCTASASYNLTGPGGCDVCPTIPNVSVSPNPTCVNATFTMNSTGLTNMGNTYGIIFKHFPAATATPYTGGTVLATVPNGSLGSGGTTATATASLAASGTYFVYAILTPTPTDPLCRPSATTTLVVNALPTPGTTVAETSGTTNNDGTICVGASVTITATGGTSFLWSTTATTAAITVSPTATTTYTVTVTNANGCTATTTRVITVNPLPTLFTVTGGGSYCTGGPGLPVGLSGSQTGVNYQLQINNVNNGAPVAGTGNPISFGTFTTVGTYTVVASTTATGCSTAMTGSVSIATFNCNISISDPCVCLNNATTLTNGQFGETIKVNAPAGQTWTVQSVNGLYSTASPPPAAAPIAIPVGTALAYIGNNMYQLEGRHVDAIGYTVTVVNQAGVSLSIGNSCQYPNPAITTDLSADFCIFSDPVDLTGTPGDANFTSAVFTVNGVPTSTFDPAQGPGQYEIVYTVDGGLPKAAGNNDPGCVQSVKTYVNVVATPSSLVCNDLVFVSVDENCEAEINPDMVLEGSYGCYDDYIVELDKTIPYGNGPWVPGFVNASDLGKTYQVRVTHLVSGNKCWGNIKVEDKLAPVLTCHDVNLNCAITQYDPAYLANVLGIQAAYPDVYENCGGSYTLTYSDTWYDTGCDDPNDLSAYVKRVWVATDASNNTASCTQYIYFQRLHVYDVLFPSDVTVDCSNGVTDPSATGTPYVQFYPIDDNLAHIDIDLYPNTTWCELGVVYADQIIPVCDGSYKILRTWTVVDWCLPTSPFPPTSNPQYYIQLIKVLDQTGPSFTCPSNLTVGTDPFNCCATVDLPDIIITDNCSRIDHITAKVVTHDAETGAVLNTYTYSGSLTDFPGNNYWTSDTLGVFGYTPACLPIGTHSVTYTVTDNCGNHTTCTFNLTVRDLTPPSANCQEFTTVAINVDDPFDCYTPANGCEGAGVTWVPASSFDSGSEDNCGTFKLTIQRMSPYSDCIENLNNEPNCGGDEYEVATSEGDSIKFYCCEVGTTQTVILTVYQLDGNGNIVYQPDGEPVANQCMVQVEVQDKIKPVCTPPANTTVSCENFDPSLWAYGKAAVADNCCLDTTKVYQGQCGLQHSANYSLFDTVCNRGTITRTFRAYDCHGFSSQCTQRVFVNYEQDYFVRFPNDVIVTVCDGTGNYGEPTFFGEDCELLGVSFEDEVFTVVPDACFKIERTWTIINWCTYNTNLPCVYVPNPNPNPVTNSTQNLPGPIVSAPGTPAPWAPSNIKVNPSDATATNYSVFYTGGTYNGTTIPGIANNNCFVYKQIIKVIDTQAPTANCPASPVEFCDLTVNNPQLWNEMYWWDGVIGQHDLCEGPSDLNVTATDACSGANINIEYLLFLDLDGDGVMETVVSSTNLPGINNVQYGNASNPNFSGGTPRAFDERGVPTNQKYRFAIDRVKSGNNLTAYVRWDTQAAQANSTNTSVDGVVPELPYGTHKIKWIISDGCGNQSVCEYTFVVKDCKAPTVVCFNGLSVNIMPTGMVTLWATDFLQYAEDNCTPPTPYTPGNQLKYAIRKSGQGTGFPVDAFGQPITNVTFTCDEVGTQPVELWAQDAAGNAAYCETYVIIQDPFNNCGGNPISVAGQLKTEPLSGDQGVEDAQVELAGTPPNGLPSINALGISDNAGQYLFSNYLPLSTDYTVTPVKDDNPMNGVSTFDLVLMSKHILGIEPLNSPYKIIAADVNKSNSVTTFDIVELRKLILGIYTELPNNTSWRFIDKGFQFANPSNPFASVPFSENISLGNAQASQSDDDFTGIKIGDLNGSVIANANQQAEDRTAGTLLLDVLTPSPSPNGEGSADREVKAGEVFDVTFRTAEQVQGFQFTMNLNGLTVADIVKGDKVSADNFGVFADALTTSIDGAGEFTVKFRADKAGKLSEMLQLSSRITRAEAYNANGQNLEVALRFSGNTIAGVGFELYQNQPNPWVGRTMVGFHLPVAATATLTVYDETGRVLFTQKGDFAKGYNAISLDRAMLNTTGVLYYKLETATDSATKKMIQTR